MTRPPALIILLVIASTAIAAGQQNNSRTVPIATVKELMVVITVPTSDTIFKASADGPATDAVWAAVARDALVLAESANLLMVPGRHAEDPEWAALAAAQRDAALVAMKAAQGKSADALSDASDKVYESCTNCHNRFMAK